MTPIEWSILGITLAVTAVNTWLTVKEKKSAKEKWQAVSTVLPGVIVALQNAADKEGKK